MMAFYGVGNHGGGPTRENLDSIRRLDGVGAMPRLRHSTPARFFESIREAGSELPVVSEELQHHAVGCYAAHSGIKRWNRRAENMLAPAEAWATVAERIAGLPYPAAELTRAWKQVLFNQFHDTLGGTAIEPAYDDARDQLGEATAIAARAQNLAVQSLSRLVNLPAEPGTFPILVFNPHAWPLRTVVELEFGGLKPTDGLVDETGTSVPFQPTQSYATVSTWRSRLAVTVDLPPLGYRTYRVVPDTPRLSSSTMRATDTLLENENVRLELDPASGRISSLVLRENGEDVADLADAGRPRAVVVDDTSDTWGHRRLAFRDEIGAFETHAVHARGAGAGPRHPAGESRYGESELVEDFVVSAASPTIEIRVILDWREHAKLLKLRFPTRLRDTVAAYEIPYGVVERPPNGEEEPGQRWVDASGELDGSGRFGLSVLNDAKYGFDVIDGDIGVTAVRSPIYAHHEPATPRADTRYAYQDQGIQRFTLGLLPHRGGWADAGAAREALVINQRPISPPGVVPRWPPGADRPRSWPSSPRTVVAGAIKLAEDGDDLVVRAVETAGRAAPARIVLPAWDREVTFDIAPFEIRTFRIPRDPSQPVAETDLLERPLAQS